MFDRPHVSNAIAAVYALARDTRESDGLWLVSGSVAMRQHGLALEPNDLDVWCSEATLSAFGTAIGVKPEVRRPETGGLRRCFAITLNGWVVEFTGTVGLRGGRSLSVDRRMVEDAVARVESPEDLIAELVCMDRPSPKDDLHRARQLARIVGGRLNLGRIQSRLLTFGVPEPEASSAAGSLLERQVPGDPNPP